jgi:hypothetical protein
MLRQTFIHLPGIGTHRERKLWDQGILDWDRFLEAAASGILPKKMCESTVPLVRQSLEAVPVGDARFFRRCFPPREAWRLYPEFADRAPFLDIETTGLSAHYDEVTLIGALGNGKLALFVKGVKGQQQVEGRANHEHDDQPERVNSRIARRPNESSHPLRCRPVSHTVGQRNGLHSRTTGVARPMSVKCRDAVPRRSLGRQIEFHDTEPSRCPGCHQWIEVTPCPACLTGLALAAFSLFFCTGLPIRRATEESVPSWRGL